MSRRDELVADVVVVAGFRHRLQYGRVVDFLVLIQLMPPGTAGSVIMADIWIAAMDCPNEIAFHNLCMIDIVQDLY